VDVAVTPAARRASPRRHFFRSVPRLHQWKPKQVSRLMDQPANADQQGDQIGRLFTLGKFF
jgi:hypothetical protein